MLIRAQISRTLFSSVFYCVCHMSCIFLLIGKFYSNVCVWFFFFFFFFGLFGCVLFAFVLFVYFQAKLSNYEK